MRIRCAEAESRCTRCASSTEFAGAFAGTRSAVGRGMRPEDRWTIPLQIIMWAVMSVGVIMVLAVLMMH